MRLLSPGLLVAFFVFSLSIVASNILKPNANKAFLKKMRSMQTNSLTFAFDEKIFNREFKNYSIRVGKKYDDGRSVDDIMVYDHTDADNSVVHLTRAKHGKIYTSADRKYLIMDLCDGYQVKEVRSQTADRQRIGHNSFARPMMRIKFSTLRKVFDLAEMLDNNVVNISYKAYDMMNTVELQTVIDSFSNEALLTQEKNLRDFNILRSPQENDTQNAELFEISNQEKRIMSEMISQSEKKRKSPRSISKKLKIKKDFFGTPSSVISISSDWPSKDVTSIIDIIQTSKIDKLIDMIKKNVQSHANLYGSNENELTVIQRTKARYIFSLHEMYAKAAVCIIFLFIGAPAGAIVKKGGFGYPLLIAIGFFITFVMSNIIGRKLMISGTLSPFAGAWLPCMILLPFAVYLSWRALNDSKPIVLPFIKRFISKS